MIVELSYFLLETGLDVFDAAGSRLGTVDAIRLILPSGIHQAIARVEGFSDETDSAFSVNGYLLVRRGLLRRRRLLVPFSAASRVVLAGVLLNQTEAELTGRAPDGQESSGEPLQPRPRRLRSTNPVEG